MRIKSRAGGHLGGWKRGGWKRGGWKRGWIEVSMLALVLLTVTGCSARKLVVRTLAGAISSGDGANVFATDDDPVLVGQALPFGLKVFEMLLQQDPENVGLLRTTCSSYTQYSYAFVELESEKLRYSDHRASREIRERAVNLYLRARDYCLEAMDLRFPGMRQRLLRQPDVAVRAFGAEDVPLLYWTAGSWGSAISAGRHRAELLVDLEVVRAMLERAIALDEDYDRGALHDAMIAIEALPEAMGGSYDEARRHYDRAVELNDGKRAGTHLAWAWLVTISRQDRVAFEEALEKALAIEEGEPEDRLANRVNQDFARFLQSQADDLFLEDPGDASLDEAPPEDP